MRVTDPLVVSLRHVALVRAVAAVAVRAGRCLPVHDAGQVGDEAPEHDLRRYAIGLAQLDEFDGQFDTEFVFAFHDVLLVIDTALDASAVCGVPAAPSRSRVKGAQRRSTAELYP